MGMTPNVTYISRMTSPYKKHSILLEETVLMAYLHTLKGVYIQVKRNILTIKLYKYEEVN